MAQQGRTYAGALVTQIDGQPAEASHRDGVARQFQVGWPVLELDGAGAERVKAPDARCISVGGHNAAADITAALLSRQFLQKSVQRRLAAIKGLVLVSWRARLSCADPESTPYGYTDVGA